MIKQSILQSLDTKRSRWLTCSFFPSWDRDEPMLEREENDVEDIWSKERPVEWYMHEKIKGFSTYQYHPPSRPSRGRARPERERGSGGGGGGERTWILNEEWIEYKRWEGETSNAKQNGGQNVLKLFHLPPSERTRVNVSQNWKGVNRTFNLPCQPAQTAGRAMAAQNEERNHHLEQKRGYSITIMILYVQ